jgi:hypothetical protein
MKCFIGVIALAVVCAVHNWAAAQILVASHWVAGDADTVAVDAFKDIGEKPVNVGAEQQDLLEDLSSSDKYADDKCADGKGCGKGFGKGGRGGCGPLACTDVFFDMELQFMRYFQEGGVTDVVGSPAQFNWDFTPRFELGVVGPRGLGFRLRYWDYEDGAISAAGDTIGVDAYYFDAELFQDYDFYCHSNLEFSLGLRYADFEQYLENLAVPGFLISGWRGWGGTVAVEARRQILWGDIYARGRLSVLVGDADAAVVLPGPVVTPSFAEGNTVTQTELAIGYEVSGYVGPALLSARVGAEWQQWSNVAMADTAFGGLGSRDIMEDAGWAGLVLGFAVQI